MIPILGLMYSTIIEGSEISDALSLILPTERRLHLLIRSILLSLSISMTSVVVAIFAVLGLYKINEREERIAGGFWRVSIFMLLLPSFLHS